MSDRPTYLLLLDILDALDKISNHSVNFKREYAVVYDVKAVLSKEIVELTLNF